MVVSSDSSWLDDFFDDFSIVGVFPVQSWDGHLLLPTTSEVNSGGRTDY